MSSEDTTETRRRAAFAERVVTQVLDAGECIGDAPAGKAWVILHSGQLAQPEARDWSWIAAHLTVAELKTIRGAMADEPSFILVMSVDGFVAVVRQDHTFVAIPPVGKRPRA